MHPTPCSARKIFVRSCKQLIDKHEKQKHINQPLEDDLFVLHQTLVCVLVLVV